ncbi:protein FAM126B-like isoform X3 [Dreissena polymorpha]|nr:protein FAM126B-like isoform X3 [Dreissena polymorpha]
MAQRIVKDWLSEYKVLSAEEVHSYAASVRHNGELIDGLLALFDDEPDIEVLDPVCNQLFEFYRSKERELQLFSLELIPSLIWLYLSYISKGQKSKCGGVETFLLAVYNLEVCNSNGKAKINDVRVPVLNKSSIYHEAQNLSLSPITESTLARFNAEESLLRDGPRPQLENINGQNRASVLAYLLQCYHDNVALLSARSHKVFSKMCSRIVTVGFPARIPSDCNLDHLVAQSSCTLDTVVLSTSSANHVGELEPRIQVGPAVLIEMLSSLYFIMFNGQTGPGIQAVVDIHNRAEYELYSDVLLVTNAIGNSLRENPSGQHDDSSIGLSLALPTSSSNYTLSKSAITNASFRTKKLPDDIPMQPDEAGKLPTIVEDESPIKPTKPVKQKPAKKEKSMEKLRAKELRNASNANNSSISNGDSSIDSVNVSIVKGQHRSGVDTIELMPLAKTKDASDASSSPFTGKHSSGVAVKSTPSLKTSAVNKDGKSAKMGAESMPSAKTSIVNKDVKNTKMAVGHSRNLSGGSVGSENFSTDL